MKKAFQSFTVDFSPCIILSKLSFCISSCSETTLAKCDRILSLKKCHKNFENRLTNKKCTPKNDLDYVFCMYKGGNPKACRGLH